MNDENQFFRPVGDICQRQVVTCHPDQGLVDVVKIMKEKNISSVVVCDDAGAPIGIITDRDLRNKVVPSGRDPATFKVADVMNSPLTTIREEDVLYEALYRMSRRHIHRLVVVGDDGALNGIITDTDILRMQSHSPHQLVRDIEKARSVEDLKVLHARIQDLVVRLSGTTTRVQDLVQLIAHLNDQILLRLIHLVRQAQCPDLPKGFAFMVMGSEGRCEQTLSTDQDNAIVYDDDLSAEDIARIETFSQVLIEQLIDIGVPACPGGIMASHSAWRRSLSEWYRELDRWLITPSPKNIPNVSMFADIRTLHGDVTLERKLKAHIYHRLAENRLFIMRMAENMLRFRPPLGWLGKIKTGTQGAIRGEVDLKKGGIFALTDGIKALALELNALDGGTHQRLQALTRQGVIKPDQAEDLQESFDFLVLMRLRAQVRAVEQGKPPNNCVALQQMSQMEQVKLKIAFEDVAKFQSFISAHFNLNLLR
ncbi:CBS domain-containing protein [Ectothiorhodospira magna]|uniref:CBS domain-containing protein n=1 Tax=Ectothiorhodospira magna TaxID=867345 RepID=A0A1H9BDY4_9GAMM|nr:putative nucleotidyltransferase substrate binding domain-containing protein [Ectothiorhodospira magna]SEP86843.1 CBS domain-containing protein [Ectothiorhodospira magna]